MVSPSKQQRQQQQQHRQPSRENKSDPRASHVRIQKGLKPLEKKSFYLDIKNHAIAAKLEAKIKELGGAIELFLVRSVNLVVSDRVDKTNHINPDKRKWGCASGGSGGPRSLRSIEVPTPTPTPPTPFLSSECPSSNSTILRGQTTQRSKSRVDAMLERALTQPQQCSVDLLDNAQNWGIPIWATDKFQTWLEKIYLSLEDTYNPKHLKQANQQSKDLKIKHLKGPYIKFESFRRTTRPVFLELSAWPTLNFDGDPGSCPFDTKKQGKLESKLISKAIKENTGDIETRNKEKCKEMTRRPRTTATRGRRTEQLVAGYCEICHIHYDNLSKHVQSKQHLNFVRNDDNFLSLDTLINAGANVEAFLKLNRTKDIEKDCNLFPNGDSNLHNVVLPEEKITKNTKTLSNFSVDEIKMVQCNGARRNLNLKLSSPHNLRARAKHESGHLLRSKGSPWHEGDKSEKFYDKLEGFTIKKRSKGTIWIEEEDPDDKYAEDILKESKQEDYKVKSFTKDIDEVYHDNNKEDNICTKHGNSDTSNLQQTIVHNNTQNGIVNSHYVSEDPDYLKSKDHEECNEDENTGPLECMVNENGIVNSSYVKSCKPCKDDTFQKENCTLQADKMILDVRKFSDDAIRITTEIVCNGHDGKTETKGFKVSQEEITHYDKSKHLRTNRRGGRNIRGRHRLSVEERLIEDNRAYYKVEVLGNKLRSSVLPGCNSQHVMSKDIDDEEKKEVPSSEKPVVVRFKRVRKSELSLLSDEAESFMFGEFKRDDSSEISDDEQSSILPRDTESEANETASSLPLDSSLNSSSPVKQEVIEEDSQDSIHLGRARKRRRTQAEAFIKDNTDYYKFETPGSRLRYQAPLTGIKDITEKEHAKKLGESEDCRQHTDVEKIYPSKPSAEIEKMQFSFEAVPKSEPWYQTYQRQDTGAEFWHYFSEGDAMKPFLLPYEIENFHETLIKNQSTFEGKKRGRGRGIGCMGRSPRKSPRCHASTLAIMSTIIRKREQQQSSTLYTIEETPLVRSCTNTPRLDHKHDLKSDIDEDLKEIAKTIDDMLSVKEMMDLDESFERFEPDDMQTDLSCYGSNMPKGAPSNLLELLDNCHDIANCLENSSCASSECGEGATESPTKRRKRRKNRTGWPGNKMKRKLQSTKTLPDVDCDREALIEKKFYHNEDFRGQHRLSAPNRLPEENNSHITSNGVPLSTVERLNKKNDALAEICTTNTSHKSCREGLAKRDKNIEITTIDTGISASTGSYAESSVSEVCNDMERNYLPNKDYSYKKDLSEIEEISENDPGNDENHENLFRKDINTITDRNFISKSIKKRQRENGASDTCESRTEMANQDLLCRKDAESGIVPNKHHNSNELSTKRQRRYNSENPDSELERHVNVYRRGRMASRRRIYSRKRQVKSSNLSSDTVYEDKNCKKDSYLSITCKKEQGVRSVKRKNESISSDIQESDLECALSQRVSPAVISPTELEQRRSSIEFQPVVRMMKIDDQVDMDHSILSVTVASNRRLRSSTSPRSNTKPPKKRLKSGRGQFRRWLKSS